MALDIEKLLSGEVVDTEPVAPTTEKITVTQNPDVTEEGFQMKDLGTIFQKEGLVGDMRVPTQPSVIIHDLGIHLRNKRDQGKLKPKGLKMLEAIESGGFLDPSVAEAIQGASYGYSDEAEALYKTFLGKNKDAYKDIQRFLSIGNPELYGGIPINLTPYQASKGIIGKELEEFREDYPTASLTSNIGGGLFTGGAIRKGMNRLGLFEQKPTLKQMAGEGFIGGGIAGYGYGEGDTGQQLASTAFGAGTGGTLGFGLGLASNLATTTGKTIKDYFSGGQHAFEKRQAKDLVKQALERDYGSTDEALLDFVNRSTGGKPDGTPFTLQELQDARSYFLFHGSDKEFAIADISEGTRRLLDATRNLPAVDEGKARQWLNNRKKGQMQRLNTDVSRAFGKDGQIFDEINAIHSAKGKQGAKLYNQSFLIRVNPKTKYAFNIDGNDISLSINDLLKTPQMQNAFKKANELNKQSRYRTGQNFNKYTLTSTGKVKVNGKVTDQVPMDFLHNMKLGLDDVIEDYANTNGYNTQVFRNLVQTKKDFLNILDKANPKYKKARNYYADQLGVENAYSKGMSLFKMSTKDLLSKNNKHVENVTELMKTYSDSEKEAFRSGAVRAIMDELGGVVTDAGETSTRDFTKRFLGAGDPFKLRFIRETFGDDTKGYAEFVKNLKLEGDIFETFSHLKGSQTATRTADAEAIKKTLKLGQERRVNVIDRLVGFFTEADDALPEAQARRISAEVVAGLATFSRPQIIKFFDSLKQTKTQKGMEDFIEVIARVRNAYTDPITASGMYGRAGKELQQGIMPLSDQSDYSMTESGFENRLRRAIRDKSYMTEQ